MTSTEFAYLVTDVSHSQRLKLLRLIKISLTRPEAREVLVDCSAQGLDPDDTLAEIERRLSH
jgi:hypothetical protein